MNEVLIVSEKELINWGNYLLSEERKKSLRKKTNEKIVTDADLSKIKTDTMNFPLSLDHGIYE